MPKDISKTFVVVLLIATIIISLIGTWVVLKTVDSLTTGKSKGAGVNSQGQVNVEVIPSSQNSKSNAVAGVSVSIIPRE